MPLAADLVRLASTDELRERLARYSYVRDQVPAGLSGRSAGHLWAAGTAAASTVTGNPLLVLGEPADVVALLLALLEHWPDTLTEPPGEVTLSRDAHLLLPPEVPVTGVRHWHHRRLTAPPPPVPEEDRVLELRGAEAELTAFLRTHSPEHALRPGDEDVVRWAGIRSDDGELLACGGHQRARYTGVPYLASIATAAHARGSGLGTAVTAWLTRRAVADTGLCTLAHYAENTAAARTYTKLRYRDDPGYTTCQLSR